MNGGKLSFYERNKTGCGYTLLEVIMVIAVLGALSTILFPNFVKTLGKHKLEIAAQELAQNIRLAQKKSIIEGAKYKISLDLHNMDNYQLLRGWKGKLVRLPQGVLLKWSTYDDGTLEFKQSTGAPIPGGGTIAMGYGDKTLYIIVSVATGRVRIGQEPP